MMTEYGFKDADYPLMGNETRWDIDQSTRLARINEKRVFWLCIPVDSGNKEEPQPMTMHDKYGDGSDDTHLCCPKCGFCITCKDCEQYGCGKKEKEKEK